MSHFDVKLSFEMWTSDTLNVHYGIHLRGRNSQINRPKGINQKPWVTLSGNLWLIANAWYDLQIVQCLASTLFIASNLVKGNFTPMIVYSKSCKRPETHINWWEFIHRWKLYFHFFYVYALLIRFTLLW